MVRISLNVTIYIKKPFLQEKLMLQNYHFLRFKKYYVKEKKAKKKIIKLRKKILNNF